NVVFATDQPSHRRGHAHAADRPGAARKTQKVGALALGQLHDGRQTNRQLARRTPLVCLQLADRVDRAARLVGELSLAQVTVPPQVSETLTKRHPVPVPGSRPTLAALVVPLFGAVQYRQCVACPPLRAKLRTKGSRHMHRASRSFLRGLVVAGCLWTLAGTALAQELPLTGPVMAVDQARGAFS